MSAMVATDVTGRPMAELLALQDRRAVVTGGAQGIGRAIVERLFEAGAAVIVADVDLPQAERTATDLGGGCSAAWIDVRDPISVAALADAASLAGGLDIWVNNAGVFPAEDPLTVELEEVERVLDVNVIGVHLGMQNASRVMIERGRGGVIVNVVSTAGFRGPGTYSGSKWAVRGMTAGLAPVVGPHGIRVLGVAPTITETAGLRARLGSGEQAASMAAGVSSRNPLGRLGVPDDVARLVAFLASDAAVFATGQTYVVDGGSLSAM